MNSKFLYHCAHKMSLETCGWKFGFVLYIVTWGVSNNVARTANACTQMFPDTELASMGNFFFWNTV